MNAGSIARHLALLLLLASVLWLASPDTPPPDADPDRMALKGVGVHMLLSEGQVPWRLLDWRDHTRLAGEAVGPGGFALQVLSHGNRDLARWQAFMAAAGRAQLQPVIRIATRYDRHRRAWRVPLADRTRRSYRREAGEIRAFLERLRWPPGERVVIVGNEPNRGDEWGGRPNPTAYVRYLRDVAAELRPLGYRVLNAPLDQYCPNTNGKFIDGVRYVDAESFIDGMFAAEPDFPSWLDGWASHAYPMGPFSADPGEQSMRIDYLNGAENPGRFDPPDGVVNRGINGYTFELAKLASRGAPPLPVWITETGWRHIEADMRSDDSHQAILTDVDVAARMREALLGPPDGSAPSGYIPWLTDPRVRAVLFFGFDGDPRKWGHSSWLRLDVNGRVLGTYAPFDVLRQLPPT